MKKGIWILAAAAVGSIVFLAAAASGVNAASEQVSLAESTVSGDAVYAEGFHLSLTAEVQYTLFWEIDCAFGAEPETKAEFTFARSDDDRMGFLETDEETFWMDLNIPLEIYYYGYYALGEENAYEIPEEFPAELVLAAAESTAAGETFSETVRLRDYYTYFPFYTSVTLYEDGVEAQGYDRGEFFADYFRIPVPEDYLIDVSLTKDSEGYITEIEMAPHDGEELPVCIYDSMGDVCYFTFFGASDTDTYDFSNTEGGFGIYCLPYGVSEDGTTEEMTTLHTLCSLDPSAEVLSLEANEEQDALLLFTEEDDAVTVTVIDPESGETLQKLTAGSADLRKTGFSLWNTADGGYVFQTKSGLTWVGYSEEEEVYTSLFCPLTADAQDVYLDEADDLDFICTGERLAYAYTDYGEISTAFHLLVLDESGILYEGEYSSNLDAAQARKESMACDVVSLSFCE